jgi:hypothetical protein
MPRASCWTPKGPRACEYAKRHPHLYRLMTERPLARELLESGVEARAAAPIIDAVGDPDGVRAMWAFAHGMTILELNGRFPPDADLDAAWERGSPRSPA